MIRFRATCGDCGFTGTYKTAELAEFHHGHHSCDKQRRLDARKARGEAMRAAVDRTPKPCLHKFAKHQHGTRACAVLDRCKCPPCAKANADTERQRQRAIAYGRWQPYVDAQPTREHVESLRAQGMGLKQVARASGVAHGVLSKLIYGDPKRNLAPSRRIRYETAIRLQVVQVDLSTLADGANVPVLGTRRRMQALVAIGWSQAELARRIGTTGANFNRIINPDAARALESVFARTARAAIALYDELWAVEPPCGTHREKITRSRSVRYAQQHEWPLPMAWFDSDIDDPAAQPNATGYDEDRVAAVMSGALIAGDVDLELALTRVDRLEVLRRGRVLMQWPTAETARQTGIPAQVFYTDISRARRSSPSSTGTGTDGRRKLPPIDELLRFLEEGYTIASIASRYDVPEDTVQQSLRRAAA